VIKLNVLVVEDNPNVASVIKHFLINSDYAIAAMVTSGEEAVEIASQRQLDLVLMDIQLAGKMDGIEAAGLIWKQFGVPVVYLTGEEDEETIFRASLTEAYGLVHKPFRRLALSSTIRMAFNKHEAECKARDKDRWLETTLRCIADAVIAVDSVGCVKFINPAAAALTGWNQPEAVGRDVLEVIKVLECGTRWPAECAVMRAIQNDAPTGDVRMRILVARDGTETIVEESAAPIVNDNQEIIGVALVFRTRTASN
jgi:PAS domain S-box-containing protein